MIRTRERDSLFPRIDRHLDRHGDIILYSPTNEFNKYLDHDRNDKYF